MTINMDDWNPIGFYKDPLTSRGWGTLIESVVNKPIGFEELVSRYNALLLEYQNRDRWMLITELEEMP